MPYLAVLGKQPAHAERLGAHLRHLPRLRRGRADPRRRNHPPDECHSPMIRQSKGLDRRYRRFTMRKVASLAILLTAALFARADDWPQWLGLKRDGASAEIVKPWK